MAKARDAFRTISEVATWLDTPAHVLRFWESKFSQIKPVKRAGGRRYYRPEDMLLLAGIKTLLHDQGLTIKGAQKLLREKGVKHVQGLSPLSVGIETGEDADDDAPAAMDSPRIERAPQPDPAPRDAAEAAPMPAPEVKTAMPPPTSRPDHFAPPPARQEPRLLALLQTVDRSVVKDRSARIAPMIARLESLRDRLRAD